MQTATGQLGKRLITFRVTDAAVPRGLRSLKTCRQFYLLEERLLALAAMFRTSGVKGTHDPTTFSLGASTLCQTASPVCSLRKFQAFTSEQDHSQT